MLYYRILIYLYLLWRSYTRHSRLENINEYKNTQLYKPIKYTHSATYLLTRNAAEIGLYRSSFLLLAAFIAYPFITFNCWEDFTYVSAWRLLCILFKPSQNRLFMLKVHASVSAPTKMHPMRTATDHSHYNAYSQSACVERPSCDPAQHRSDSGHCLQTSQNCFVYWFVRSRRIRDILILSRRL